MQAIEVMARSLHYPCGFGRRYLRRGHIQILHLAVVGLVAMSGYAQSACAGPRAASVIRPSLAGSGLTPAARFVVI